MSWLRRGNIRGPQGPQGPKGDTPPLTDVFLAAHPVGSLYWATSDAPGPQQAYGGAWVERPSVLGGRIWERTA